MKYHTNNIYAIKLYEEYKFIKMYIRNLKYCIEVSDEEKRELQRMIKFYRGVAFIQDNDRIFSSNLWKKFNTCIISDADKLTKMFFSNPLKEYDLAILSDVIEIKTDLKQYLKALLKMESKQESRLDFLKTKTECPYKSCDHDNDIYIQCSCGSKIKGSGEWSKINIYEHIHTQKHTQYCIENNHLTPSEKQELDFLQPIISKPVYKKNSFLSFSDKLKELNIIKK